MPDPVITLLRTPGRAPRVLTIDAEEWFHVCGEEAYADPRRWDAFAPRVETTLTRLLDLLTQGGHRATVFFLGWIAQRYPDLAREAARRGHEIGVHGDLHRRADEMTPAEFQHDAARAREKVERAAGVAPTAYRAAEWSIRHPNDPALAALAAVGFRCDASMTCVPPLGRADNPAGPCRIAFAAGSIVEVPPLTGRGFGRLLPMGGGWPFRILPVERLSRAEEVFRGRGLPAVFTFHPWEFDAEHPAMDGLPPLARLIHFAGLPGLPARFERWLAQERAVALEDAVVQLNPLAA
jgi:polysaccharide deacetylase family protein (PEP-CTERM system associated)